MELDIAIVLIIIALGIFLFVTEWISVDSTSILLMALLMVTGILTAEEGLSGFSNPATGTVAAMFVLSAGLFSTGALNPIADLLTRAGKKSYLLGLLSVMLISGCLSAFINDTAVVALFIPVVMSMAKSTNINPSKLLMPLSFGALFGGCCTLIGTSTNILVSSIATKMGEPELTMFEFAPFGLIVLLVGTIYMVLTRSKLIPDRKIKYNLEEKYGMGAYLTDIILLPDSQSIGVKLQDAQLVKDMDLDVISIFRDGNRLSPHPSRVLLEGDILNVRCNVEVLRKLRIKQGIKLKPEKKFQVAEPKNTQLLEAVITPSSNFEGRTLKDIDLRSKYQANVLAIRHRDEFLHEGLGSVKLLAGDVLLITIRKDNLENLRKTPNLLVVFDHEGVEFNTGKILYAVAILAGVVIAAATGIVPIMTSAIIGCLVMVFTGCLKPQEAYKSINWKVIFLLAGVLSLGTALEKTGAADLLAEFLINTIGSYGPHALLATFFILTLILTNFMSNNATAALIAPIAIITAHSIGISAKPLIMGVTYAASLSLMTPVGYQTNAMIYGPGNYRFSDYFKVGAPLNLIFVILGILLIPLIFPF